MTRGYGVLGFFQLQWSWYAQEILEAVSEMGAMDNTIIVLTGDHGEHLGVKRFITVITVLAVWKHVVIFEGSLEVKLPTIWTDEKQSREEAERRERLEERRVEEKE